MKKSFYRVIKCDIIKSRADEVTETGLYRIGDQYYRGFETKEEAIKNALRSAKITLKLNRLSKDEEGVNEQLLFIKKYETDPIEISKLEKWLQEHK